MEKDDFSRMTKDILKCPGIRSVRKCGSFEVLLLIILQIGPHYCDCSSCS